MNITIAVTKTDIKEGKPSNCRYCPLARAIRRRLRKRYNYVSVDYGTALICTHDGYMVIPRTEFALPPRVVQFVRDVDRKKRVQPIRFTISIAKKFIRNV